MAQFFDPATALYGAPDLLSSPQLALAAASDSDPAGTAQTLAQTSRMVATSRGLQENAAEHGDGFVHELFGGIGHSIHSVLHVAGEGLHQLGRPLRDVQHDYRYLRDVYAHHGFFAGAAETLGIVAAGTGGFLLGGSLGAAAAADAAASLEQRMFFADSRARTRDPSAPGYVRGISPGRDLARLVGLGDTDHGLGKVVSGVGDAAFDFTADPFIVGAKAQSLRKGVEGLTGLRGYQRAAMAGRTTALTHFVDRFAPGLRIELTNPAGVDNARRAYGGYRRALDDIANLDTGGVISKYGTDLQGLAPELGQARTADEVHNVFRQAAFDKEMNDRLSGSVLPSRSLLRAPFSATNEYLKNLAPGQSVADQQGIIRAVGSSVLHPTQVKANLEGAVARKVRTFTGYMPYAIDRGTLDISRTTFNPRDTSGLQGMLRVMRFSMGEQAARRWVHEFATAPDMSSKKAIYTEALTDMFKAGGLDDSHPLVQQVHSLVGGKVAGSATGELYGYGRTLKAGVSEVTHGGGTDQLALWEHQVGDFSYPDFFQFKNALRDTNAFSRTYGKVDDFAAHYYTNGFFKPLALVTLGFGLRVAASELIPATFRYGAAALLANRIAGTAAKQRYKLAEGEDGHVLAASAKLVGGIDKLVNSEADHDLATRIILRNEGHLVKGVASTGENSLALPSDATERVKAEQWYLKQRKARVSFQADTNSFQALTRDADQYQDYWMAGLQRASQEKAAQNIARDLLEFRRRGMSEPAALRQATKFEAGRIRLAGPDDPYARARESLARFGVQEPEEFAAARVDDVANQLTGDNGTFHEHLASMLADGKKPTRDILDEIDVQSRPGAVVGHDFVPYVGGNLINRVVQEGFQRVVDPVINHISREPIFFAAVKQNYKALEKAVEKGILTEDEALSRAMYRGSLDMLPQIHNTALRSQFSQLLRNYLPFYFAQEQALKRTGYLISQHPAALEQYQLIEHGLSDPNFVHTDDQGGRHLMIPLASGIGGHFLNSAAALGLPLQGGLPLSVSGDMASLKTVLPEIQQPGVTPMASIALNKVAQFFPEYSPEVKGVVGERGFGRSIADQLIPNAPLRNLVKGLRADEADRSFSSAFATALAAASYHGDVPPPDASPAEQQAFIDRIKNNTRSMFFMKAILSGLSPLSPTVSQEDAGLSDEFHKLVLEKGSYGAGVQAFLERHGDKGISYTVAKSESTNGTQIPYTNAAIQFINAHPGLLTSGDTQLAAAALVPQEEGPGDVQTIHDEMLRMHLRARRTPEQFRDALYVQQGNRQYFADYAKHKEAVTALANDPVALAAENSAWTDYVEGMKLANPVWAADFYSPVDKQRAQKTLEQLNALFASGQAPAGTQTDLVRGLLEDYVGHNLALAAYGNDRSLAHQRQVERDAWDDYLDKRMAEEPRLASVISSVFKQLGRNG